MLRGGYYIKARKIQDSQIAHMPPHIREIWDWLIKEANHKNAVFMGREINRGELLTSYNDIREGLHWMIGWRKEMYSKWHCEKAMKVLKKADMITTMKATHRLLIKIVKYDLYQDPSNYESHKEKPTRATRKPQTTDTINKKDKNDKNNNTYYGHFEKFWNMYPNKVNKKKAKDKFFSISLEEIPKLLNGLGRQIKSDQWTKDNGRFVPHPTTWLNGERWNDEVVVKGQDISERRKL